MPRVEAAIKRLAYAREHVGRPSAGRDEYGELPTALEIEEGETHKAYAAKPRSEGLRAEWDRLYLELLTRQGQANVSITRCRGCHTTRFQRNGGPCGACGTFLRPFDAARIAAEMEAARND